MISVELASIPGIYGLAIFQVRVMGMIVGIQSVNLICYVSHVTS